MIEYLLVFKAYDFMIKENMLFVYLFIMAFGVSFVRDYLYYIYSIKKSYKAAKMVAKQYNYLQRIWGVHLYENVYKKVDRLYFNAIYRVYHVYLILIVCTLIATFASKFFDLFNIVTCVLFYGSIVLCLITFIVGFLSTKISPLGGREYRSEKKYRGKKNW